MSLARILFLALVSYGLFFSFGSPAQSFDPAILHGIKPRAVGPAGMSGRITDIAVHDGVREIIYAGSASGGLWKSESGGIDWMPIFDEAPIGSVGCIALDPSNADLIWVGTGEGNPRNSQNSGAGIFKSHDGGHTWQHAGLPHSRNIHRILVDPTDPETVYAGVQGSAWGDSDERGVYKTTDGGRSWERILFVNASTGIADLVMDPENPKKLIAAMWEFRRWPWFFNSGGPGSALYITWDGGTSWKKITAKDGLPPTPLGRIGLAIAPSNPDIVYALIESEKNARYRSEDGGLTWKLTNDKNVGNRPFYYADIYVDPKDPMRIYNLHTFVSKSEDGGKTFEDMLIWDNNPTNIHPDHHAWWIDPDNPDRMLDGNDGGLNITYDGGKTWRFIGNLPLGQFYHINYDLERPYNIYGGMQDNGSWKGPAYTWSNGGIRNSQWAEVNFGDGFDVAPDPGNARFGYSMWQGGNLSRHDVLTGHKRYIKPVHPEGKTLRFNWNAGIAMDPFDKHTLFIGSQFVHKSTDNGLSWSIISPDLTTNDPDKQRQAESGGLTPDVTTAENFTTIVSIEPSPIEPGLIWVGSDDGMLHVTRNGGDNWTNLTRMLTGVPKGSWIAQIHASRIHDGEAFVSVNNYRRNDWKPYLMHTTDYGKTWKNIASEKGIKGHVLSAFQDIRQPELIFAGTETGLYFSLDYGSNWHKWSKTLPSVPVMDLKVHPEEHDLILGTFGRSAYVVDDILPLRQLAAAGPRILEKPIVCFTAKEAYQAWYKEAQGTRFAANAEFIGENRPYGAGISFYIKEFNASKETKDSTDYAEYDSLQVDIKKPDGQIVRSMKAACKPGINRFYWDLKRNGVRSPQTPRKAGQQQPAGRKVVPGTYWVCLQYGAHSDSVEVAVLPDPRLEADDQAIAKAEILWQRHEKNKSAATLMADHLRQLLETTGFVTSQLKHYPENTADTVSNYSRTVEDTIKQVLHRIIPDENAKGIPDGTRFLYHRQLQAEAYLTSLSAAEAPSEDAGRAIRQYEQMQAEIGHSLNTIAEEIWPQYLQFLKQHQVRCLEQYPAMPTE
jgi:photosystem II stability/assembly factor-like uncharacterized protein